MIPVEFLEDYRRDQKELVFDLSRDIVVGSDPVTADCPNCYYDGVAGSSSATPTNFVGSVTVFEGTSEERTYTALSFNNICPICRGKGKLVSANESIIPAHVLWYSDKFAKSYPDSPAGYSGQNLIKIKTDSKYYEDFLHAVYFIIDGVRVLPSSTPVIRGMGSDDGIVEMFCKTTEVGKETNR
jgi:hypothetical protein